MSVEVPGGFNKFPATQLCVVTTITIPLIANMLFYKYLFIVKNDPFILEYKQYWRLLVFQMSCVNESDVVLLVLIWYHFRQIERLMGSYKYISVITLCLIYTTVIISGFALLVNMLPWRIWQKYPSGSLPLVLALFHFYKQYTPQIYEFEFKFTKPWSGLFTKSTEEQRLTTKKNYKWRLTDQFYIESLIVILCFNQGFAGVVTGFISWIIGIFVDQGLLPGVKSWRLPLFLFGASNETHSTVTPADGRANINTHEDEPPRSLGRQFIDTFRG